MHPRIQVYVFFPFGLTLTLPSHAQLTVTDRGREERAWVRGRRDRCGRDGRDLHHAYIKINCCRRHSPDALEKNPIRELSLGSVCETGKLVCILV